MKIKYDLSKNFFKAYNEFNGIISLKKKILKGNNVKIKGYIRQLCDILIYSIIFLFLLVCFLDLFDFEINDFSFIFELSGLFVLVIMLYMYWFFMLYRRNKTLSHIGEIVIDDEKITDKTNMGVTFSVSWDQIEALVISKKVIVFIIKDSVANIFLNVECRNQLLKAIKKYNKELKIFDYTE